MVHFQQLPLCRHGLAAVFAERTAGDRVAEPVDSIISSPGAYGVLGALYTALAVPAALFPHSVMFHKLHIALHFL